MSRRRQLRIWERSPSRTPLPCNGCDRARAEGIGRDQSGPNDRQPPVATYLTGATIGAVASAFVEQLGEPSPDGILQKDSVPTEVHLDLSTGMFLLLGKQVLCPQEVANAPQPLGPLAHNREVGVRVSGLQRHGQPQSPSASQHGTPGDN